MTEPGRHVALVGATASGKSALALGLARARPDLRAGVGRLHAGVPGDGHRHGQADAGRAGRGAATTCSTWSTRGRTSRSPGSSARRSDALADIEARGRRALLVGGTGLYVQAVVDDLDIPGRYPDVRAELEAEADTGAAAPAPDRARPGRRRTHGAGQPAADRAGPRGHPRQRPAVLQLRSRPRRLPADAVHDRRPRPRPRRPPGPHRGRFDAQMDAGFLDEVARPAAPPRTACREPPPRPSATRSCWPTSRARPRSTRRRRPGRHAAPAGSPAASGRGSAATPASRGSTPRAERRRTPTLVASDRTRSGRRRLTPHAPDQAPRPGQRLPRPARPDGTTPVTPADAVALCDRRTGVGADGLLRVTAGADGADVDDGSSSTPTAAGRDERQRHPLPGPGRVPAPGACRPARPSRSRPTPALRAVDARPATSPAHQCISVDMGPAKVADAEPEWPTATSLRPPGSTSATPTSCCVVDDELPDRGARSLGATRRGRHPGGINVEVIARRRRPDELDHAACTSAASASPRRAAPAPARPPPRPTSWGLVGDRGRRCTCPAARSSVDAGRDRRRSPATSRPSPPSSAVAVMSCRVSLIERTFREKIVLVGVTLAAGHRRGHRGRPRRARAAGRHRRRRRGRPRRAAPGRARPGHLRRQGQGRGARELALGRRLRHRRLRRRAHPGPAAQPREAPRAHRHRPHRGDPRHLRPERPQPGGQGPGRAGPAPLPPAPAPGQGHRPLAAGRRRSGRRRRIGTRGPGETQLEVDRRRILRRIHKLEAELRQIDKHRATQRKAQHRSRTQRVAIVGYTNAGKSTLLNRLTDAGRAGRGPAVRHPRRHHPPARPARRRDGAAHRHGRVHPQAAPPAGRGVQVDAGVVADADLLVHVVDASAGDPEGNIDAVRSVLREIGADEVPVLSRSTRPTSSPAKPRGWPRCTRARWPSAPPPARASTTCCARSATGCGRSPRRRAGRPLRPGRRARRRPPRGRGAGRARPTTTACELRVRLDDASLGQFTEYVTAT